MFFRKHRSFLNITASLLITSILVFVFSPAARAALETIFNFNGVNVSVNMDTNQLIVSGNLDAVVEQTDHSVTIMGENGEEGGAGIAVAQAVELVNVTDLLSNHPDLILPNVPTVYELDPQGESAGEDLKFTWRDPAGHMIIYSLSRLSIQEGATAIPDGISEPSLNSGNGVMTIDGLSVSILIYSWETNGFLRELMLTDLTLSGPALQAMLP